MGIDLKYGKVTTEFGNIGEDEPVIVFRAKDMTLPKLLAYYHMFCLQAGSPFRHLNLIMKSREAVMKWQLLNPISVPNSESSKAWMKE